MKTVEELYAAMAARVQELTGQTVSQSGDLAVRLYAVAAQIYAMQVQVEWVARECFPQTASGTYLDQHAQLRGITRRAAARAEGKLRFTVESAAESDLSIPVGTVCMTAGLVRFETTEEGTLPAGETSVLVPARAVVPGTAGNVGAGTILVMAVAPVGISACSNPAAFQGGTEQESDEDLRRRVQETFERLPNGANAAFYEQGAKSFPEVAAAVVLPRNRGKGTVDIVVATRSGLPGEALLEELEEYFQERREIAVDVDVLAPEVKTVQVAAQVAAQAGYSQTQVQQAVKTAIQSWFDGTRLGRSVLRAELGERIFAVEGVANYVLLQPQADVSVERTELPQLESVSVSALGGEA